MLEPLVIWGASGHALVVADIVRLGGKYEIAGLLDDVGLDRRGAEFAGSTVLGGREQLDALYDGGTNHLIVAIGDCEARLQLAELARSKGFHLATAIHPRAIIAGAVSIGAGSVIAAGAIINPGCRIGENVIVNTGATVDHECVIGDGVHIGPGAHLGGRVEVGRASWVGIGATVIHQVRIGAGTIIGAGAVVVSDIPDNVVAYGVPAKVVKGRNNG
ncbi:MAG TPA: acetyltransferase [Chloroflexia bacterium]|nr:acetyltransferase [Chloroflexia bacterium]